MNGLAAEYDGQALEFVRLNAAEPDNEAIQRGYGLRGHPTVAILGAEGNVSATFIGGQSAETLRSAIDAMLNDG